MRYACRHWFYHFAEASDHLKQMVLAKDLRELLYHHLIPWRIFLAIDVPCEPWGRFDDVLPQVREPNSTIQLFIDRLDRRKILTYWNQLFAPFLGRRIVLVMLIIATRIPIRIISLVIVFVFLGMAILSLWMIMWTLEDGLEEKLENALVRQREIERCVQFEKVWMKVCFADYLLRQLVTYISCEMQAFSSSRRFMWHIIFYAALFWTQHRLENNRKLMASLVPELLPKWRETIQKAEELVQQMRSFME
jgi:hypothetical protein